MLAHAGRTVHAYLTSPQLSVSMAWNSSLAQPDNAGSRKQRHVCDPTSAGHGRHLTSLQLSVSMAWNSCLTQLDNAGSRKQRHVCDPTRSQRGSDSSGPAVWMKV